MNRIAGSDRHVRHSRPTASNRPESLSAVQRRLASGVKAGTITSAEAAPLQARLDALSRRTRDGFDRQPGQRRERDVRLLGARVDAAARNAEVDVAVMAKGVEQRITAGLDEGTLTPAEGEGLRRKLEALRARAQVAATPEEKAAVGRAFLQLGREVRSERGDSDFDMTNRKAALLAKIGAGTSDGSLTADESARLRARLDTLSATSSTDAWDAVDRTITTECADAQVNVRLMTESLSRTIGELEASGLLPRTQADAARAALAELKAPGAKNVARRLARLRAQLSAVSN